MSPYFREEDIPEPWCDGSSRELSWKGGWDDPDRPKEILCPVCGVKLTPEYALDEKNIVFHGYVPSHYPGEAH